MKAIPTDRKDVMKLFKEYIETFNERIHRYCSSYNLSTFPSSKYYDLYAYEQQKQSSIFLLFFCLYEL